MTDKCPSCGKTLEVWTADEGICSAIIFDAACAAPRLAAEVERLRAENTRLRECAERVSHAWKFIDPDNIKIMSDAVTALDDALHPLLWQTEK